MTMTEVIVFPDAVTVCRAYLAAGLDDVGDEAHVGSRLSNDARQVVLKLVDAEIKSRVMQLSTIRVDCLVDETLGQTEAQDLGQFCRGLLGAMAGTTQAGTRVYKVKDGPSGLSDDPDPISGKARYSFHVIVSLRGEAISAEPVLVTESGVPLLVV